MLSPEEFRETYSEDELREELPESPIASIRGLQYLYGKLYTLGTLGGGEYAPYLTPDEADDLVDTDDSLVVVRVDLSGDEPTLAADERGPVWVTRYTEEHVQKVAHCYYQNRGSGIDHSITHKSGQDKPPEKLGEYAVDRFTRWPSEDAVQQIAENHDDGYILKKLDKLGEDDELTQKIKEKTQRKLGEDRTAIITVQLKVEKNGEYRWPAQVEILMQGMRVQRLSKLVTKNKASDSSGEASDLITGNRTRTVGTAQDPLNYFLGKQRETFPGLDVEDAWRSHPLSEDAAVTVMNAGEFIEACSYRTFGAKVFYLPYFFGRPSPETALKIYKMLYSAVEEEEWATPIERVYEKQRAKDDEDDDLRFYISAVMPHQNSRYDVFGETLNGRLLYPKELAFEHNRITETSAFDSTTDWTAPLPTNENWALLVSDDERLRSVSTGWYFHQTFAERDDTDADADDPRIGALVKVLSGDALAVETLLEEFVERIASDENDDDVETFPSFRVAGQFAQLCALATDDLDLLTTDDADKEPITREPTYEVHTMPTLEDIAITDGGNPAAAKLDSFIENTPALAHDEDAPVNDERRGAFMLGALVGEVGSYQEYSEDRSTTLVDQFPVKSITQARVKKVTQETIGKTLTYTRQQKKGGTTFPGTMFEHVIDRLRETILKPDPDDWEIGTDDLRFYYALGITYGMNDHPDWDEDADASEPIDADDTSDATEVTDAADANTEADAATETEEDI